MKRIPAGVCALALLLALLSLPVFSAPAGASLSVSAPEDVPLGEEFQVELTFTPSEGATVGAWLVSLSYDPAALSYLSGADAERDGTLIFCDSPETPRSSLTFTLRFRALGGQPTLRFTQVQLVDFESMTPLPAETPEISVSVLIDPAGLGDLDKSGSTDSDDAVYLLFHTLFPSDYPVDKATDYDKSGSTDSDDAIYLLFFTLFPRDYPLLTI